MIFTLFNFFKNEKIDENYDHTLTEIDGYSILDFNRRGLFLYESDLEEGIDERYIRKNQRNNKRKLKNKSH